MTTPDPQDQPEQDGYSLVMPFVVCQTNGGPYEDQAFVAGFQAGQIDRSLAVLAAADGTEAWSVVRTDLIPQLDLIAMRHGFPATKATDRDGGWSIWSCRREIDPYGEGA